ncbi:COX15/CtaA family protein [Tepidimonas charontis]|uniref:Heme A synthase n=1 Tax=Tepidimonas charontis TaxID=2267262 RepID=A0A554X9F0_9BURK|nr:COX15/CtaA family protein [Tepidimonas charontis]TSE32475.1 Heme A synthase [Tepidimonas charontis]
MSTLVDWTPVFRLMWLGALIAAVPLAWVWLRSRQADTAARLRLLTGVTLFLTFDLVLFGAFTRLTDSGLGCPDWPGCYGTASPIGARADIAAAQAALPGGPVTFAKAWIEMIHRYLATAVGALIVVLALVSVLERRHRPVPVLWPIVTLVWVCVQGAFGALTVTMKLAPAIVTLHLMGGLVLLALLRLQAVRYGTPDALSAAAARLGPGLRAALWAVFALVWLQVALGGWVSTNYAVLACRDFPTCQGSWWPSMDFARGFELWRELGAQGSGEALPFAALTAIHYTHRLAAYVVLAALAWLGWTLRRKGLPRHARWLWGLAAWQLLTGLSNIVLEWPLLAAVAHTGGAAALVTVLAGWLAAAYPAARGVWAPGAAAAAVRTRSAA